MWSRCPVCGFPRQVCHCPRRKPSLNSINKTDVSFQCYAIPKTIYFFNGEDPNRWLTLVRLVNEEFKVIRDIYWDFEEELMTTNEKDVVLNKENTNELKHLIHHIETIHDLMAPSFVNNDIPIEKYNKFIDELEDWKNWIKKMTTLGNFTFAFIELQDHLDAFFKAVEDCIPHVKKEESEEAMKKEKELLKQYLNNVENNK